MKSNIKLLCAFVVMICCYNMNAQYNSAIGARFTEDALLGSYKFNKNERLSMEGILGYQSESNFRLLFMGGEFHLNTEIPDVSNLKWFYGAGASAALASRGRIIYFYGTGGLDYFFDEIPLNLSLQAMSGPRRIFGATKFGFDVALSARYILD